jgi:hypothetical protein
MPLLQGKVAKKRNDMNAIMWKGGMMVQRISEPTQPEIEGLISISDKERAIKALDIITRGPPHCHRDVKQFLDKLHHVVMRIMDKKCPGSRVEKRYLSHKQITAHVVKPISYSQEEVDWANKDKGVLPNKSVNEIITDNVIDLLAVNDDHIIYKLQSLSKHCGDHWKEIGCGLLDMSKSKVNDLAAVLREGATTDDKFCHIMETWIKLQWRTATLDDFLDVCDRTDRQLRQLVNEELSEAKGNAVVAETMEIVAETLMDNPIFDVVVKLGESQWYSFGIALGFNGAQIETCTFGKSTNACKLRSLIDQKAREYGVKRTKQRLLTACRKVSPPIIDRVEEYRRSMSQHGSLLEETRNDDAELTLEQRATNVHGPSVGSNLGRAEAESKGKDDMSSSLAIKVGQMVGHQQLVAVARDIAETWEEIASYLSPEVFSVVKLEEMKQDHESSLVQAQAMLESWRETFGCDATCSELIHSLCQMDHRLVATKVFGCEMVDFVERLP